MTWCQADAALFGTHSDREVAAGTSGDVHRAYQTSDRRAAEPEPEPSWAVWGLGFRYAFAFFHIRLLEPAPLESIPGCRCSLLHQPSELHELVHHPR